jgi:hypothetical protein
MAEKYWELWRGESEREEKNKTSHQPPTSSPEPVAQLVAVLTANQKVYRVRAQLGLNQNEAIFSVDLNRQDCCGGSRVGVPILPFPGWLPPFAESQLVVANVVTNHQPPINQLIQQCKLNNIP